MRLFLPIMLIGLAGLASTAAAQPGDEHWECRLPASQTDGVYEAARLWPGGIVPYVFNQNVSAANQVKAREAMDTIEAVCNVEFIPRTNEADYVELRNDTSSYSEWIGKRGGVQIVGILPWDARFIIVHELMHALGAWHEHQRTDRDPYITTNMANVASGQESNFTTRPAATNFAWYDFDSVMHYRRFQFTANGFATIESKPGFERWRFRIGQVTHLSTGDMWLLKQMYPYPGGTPFPPPVFDLVSPSSAAAVGTGWPVALSWTPAQYTSPLTLPPPNGNSVQADSYQVVIDDDPYFRSPMIDTTVNGASYAAGTLADGKLYFWTVIAQNAGGSTKPWHTPVASFYTGTSVPAVIFVDESALPGGDGTSWATAFQDLQDAIALAECAGGTAVEIRVGQGTYKPDRGSGDRDASFVLRSNLTVRGGYAGFGAPDPDARSIAGFPTVLSGDLAGDDGPSFQNYSDNSQHILRATGQRSGAVTLDGLTITGGNADGQFVPTGQGGGLWVDDCQMNLSNCSFIACRATLDGGGVFLQDSDAVLTDCTFTGNACLAETPTRAGGLMVDNGGRTVTLANCAFTGNQATRAGGAFFRFSLPRVKNGLFENNTATLHGGGSMVIAADASFDECVFRGNTAKGAFGGGLLVGSSGPLLGSVTLINCLLTGNSAPTGGGAVEAEGGSGLSARNCTISGNTAPLGAGFYVVGQYLPPAPQAPVPTSLSVWNSIIYGNAASQLSVGAVSAAEIGYSNVQGGWPGSNINADPLFESSANFALRSGSPCIDAGSNPAVPLAALTDLLGNPRFHDDTGTVNTGLPGGAGGPAIVDMGALEFQGTTCYANCDRSSSPPVLNVNDFICFQQKFAASDPYANCDGSTTPPVLNVNDFICFQQKFAAGCP